MSEHREGESQQTIVLTELSDEEVSQMEARDVGDGVTKDIESLSSTTSFLDSVTKIHQLGSSMFPSMQNIQPWGEFFSDFGEVPLHPVQLYERTVANRALFMPNYMMVLALLTTYGVIVTPTLLFFMVASLVFIAYKRSWCPGEVKTYEMFGREWKLGDRERIAFFVATCLILSIITGSIFVLIPTSLCWLLLAGGHSIAHKPKQEELFAAAEDQ